MGPCRMRGGSRARERWPLPLVRMHCTARVGTVAPRIARPLGVCSRSWGLGPHLCFLVSIGGFSRQSVQQPLACPPRPAVRPGLHILTWYSVGSFPTSRVKHWSWAEVRRCAAQAVLSSEAGLSRCSHACRGSPSSQPTLAGTQTADSRPPSRSFSGGPVNARGALVGWVMTV